MQIVMWILVSLALVALCFAGFRPVDKKITQARITMLDVQLKYARLDRDDALRRIDALAVVLESALEYLHSTEQVAQLVAHSSPFCAELTGLFESYRLSPAKIVASRPPLARALTMIEQQNWIAFDKIRPQLGRPGDTCKAPPLNQLDVDSDSVRRVWHDFSESVPPQSIGGNTGQNHR